MFDMYLWQTQDRNLKQSSHLYSHSNLQYVSHFIQMFVNAREFKKRLINVLMLINKQPITAEIVYQLHYDIYQ